MHGNNIVHIVDSDPCYPWVENMVYNRKFEKYMDVTAWLNGDNRYKRLECIKEQQIKARV